MQAWTRGVKFVVGVTAVVVAVAGFFFFRDNFFTHYPIKVISAAVYRAFGIPWWNFYDGGGQPLAGNPNTLTFYPDNILYLFLPAHVAFNFHFLLHLVAAWFAMRALCRANGASEYASNFAATMYAMSGVAISALAFYNLITSIALIPFALWAIEADASPLVLGAAFGLIGLAGEPVIAISTGIAALIIGWRRLPRIALAIAISVVIALPQLLAYAEIAREVERAVGFSANATLAASIWPRRIAEIAIGPILGFLTDAGHAAFRDRLFSTIFLGVIVIPAVVRRSRYVVVAAVMLFLGLGRFNPVVAAFVDAVPRLRIARYPEKFAIALSVALVVLVALYVDRTKWRTAWLAITFAPLAVVLVLATPIDWFAPYRVPPVTPLRVCVDEPAGWGAQPARQEYRGRGVHTLPPIFGAVAGLRYGANRSPEGMHSLMSRIVAERIAATRLAQYRRICGCANVPGALPMSWIVPRVIPIRNVNEEVRAIESGDFDEHAAALAPSQFASIASPADARITRYAEGLQDITIGVTTSANALLFVNQSFFRAWVARSGDRELSTLPLDIDRLGIIVPRGEHTIVLTFGRHRTAVAIAWIVSSLLLVASVLVEIRDRRTREIQRAGDQNAPRV